MDVKEIISEMQNPSAEDVVLVTKAFNFAKEAHKGDMRYSGEPYFTHVSTTAKNLAELGMDSGVIAAGLLHDVLEDAGVKAEAIEKEFGSEILFLIEGVTKLGKLKYRGAKRHTDSLRKLFVAMAQDIRVLIIKLTDRLHNMETLKYVPAPKQKRIAMETLEIYAPLAYRLGMRKLNRELEDLAFPYVYPDEYRHVKAFLKKKSAETVARLTKILNNIKKALAKENITTFKTDYRIKGLYSLYKKLVRKEMDIEKVYDLSAVRIMVGTVDECYRVLGIIHANWRPLPGRIKDYIAFQKPNGYRSLHTTIFTGDGSIVEVQIRTHEMHREAEYGIASHLSYKEILGEKPLSSNLLWFTWLLPIRNPFGRISSEAVKKTNKKEFVDVPQWIKHLAEVEISNTPDEYISDLKSDFLKYRMFVFTPKGDVVDLPIDSTPVDFAYAIHSEVGDHISGVKVNGKLVSLDTPLKNGDTIEVITKNSSHPTEKWLEYAKTAAAKKHIKSVVEKLRA